MKTENGKTGEDGPFPSARLDALERKALRAALEGVEGEVFLFGSRTNPSARGGDIDLLILTPADPYRTAREVSTRFRLVCEEKIDVLAADPDDLPPETAFFIDSLDLLPIHSMPHP